MSTPIWRTKDGRYAVSLAGEPHYVYPTFADAEIALSGKRSLGNFLNIPISGKRLRDWMAADAAMREEHEAIEKETS